MAASASNASGHTSRAALQNSLRSLSRDMCEPGSQAPPSVALRWLDFFARRTSAWVHPQVSGAAGCAGSFSGATLSAPRASVAIPPTVHGSPRRPPASSVAPRPAAPLVALGASGESAGLTPLPLRLSWAAAFVALALLADDGSAQAILALRAREEGDRAHRRLSRRVQGWPGDGRLLERGRTYWAGGACWAAGTRESTGPAGRAGSARVVGRDVLLRHDGARIGPVGARGFVYLDSVGASLGLDPNGYPYATQSQ
jgi:hypothetical protein